MATANPSALLQHSTEGELICVSLTQSVGVGPLALLISDVTVRECVINAQ
jgi:hypothetical protein